MAMTLSSMKTKVATATVTWQGESVDVGYFPAALTPAYLENLQATAKEAKANADAKGQFDALVLPVLAWWDILDDDEQRLPVTAEVLRDLPLKFLTAVITATQEEMRPPAPKVSAAG